MNTETTNADTPRDEPDASAELDELVLDFLERAEGEGLVALLALCAEHPAHADELRRRIETLVAFDLIDLVLSNERASDA